MPGDERKRGTSPLLLTAGESTNETEAKATGDLQWAAQDRWSALCY
jgi:hypothetical protein